MKERKRTGDNGSLFLQIELIYNKKVDDITMEKMYPWALSLTQLNK